MAGTKHENESPEAPPETMTLEVCCGRMVVHIKKPELPNDEGVTLAIELGKDENGSLRVHMLDPETLKSIASIASIGIERVPYVAVGVSNLIGALVRLQREEGPNVIAKLEGEQRSTVKA